MEEISETRKILEQELAKYETTENGNKEEIEKSALQEDIADAADYSALPKSFKKEMAELFKQLPSEMQKYLHQKDLEDEEKYNKLQEKLKAKQWIDDIYHKHSLRLKSYGLEDAEEWFKYLADLDEALENNPQAGIAYLARIYGLEHADKTDAKTRMREAWRAVSSLMQAVDEQGNAKFPYIDMVKAQMGGLLQCGASCDLEDAYHKAVWLNPQVREILIKQRAEAALKEKAKEAEKAKQAAFAPKGRLSQADMSKLSTRELLTRLIND